MRVRVFARGANPRIDRPNQRKSLAYATEEVEAGRADWIDKNNHAEGILCREFLYSGQSLVVAAPETISKLGRPRPSPLPPLEAGGTVFDDPVTSYSTRQERARLVVSARATAWFGVPLEVVQQL
jgi:hypothetical protein